MAFIITELVYICLGASWRTPLGAEISRCIEDLLVTFCCCLLYGWVVVSLAHSPFPFSILYITFHTKTNLSNNSTAQYLASADSLSLSHVRKTNSADLPALNRPWKRSYRWWTVLGIFSLFTTSNISYINFTILCKFKSFLWIPHNSPWQRITSLEQIK